MATPRYCLITPDYPAGGRRRSGWATYAHTVAETLRRDGVEVTVVVTSDGADERPSPGIRVIHAPMHWSRTAPTGLRAGLALIRATALVAPGLLEGLRLARVVRQLDREGRFDVIEGQNAGGVCWALPRRFGDRFVLRSHTSVQDSVDDAFRATWHSRFTTRLDGIAARGARAVLTQSTVHAEKTARDYRLPRTAIEIIEHAVLDAPVAGDGDPHRIVAVGNANRRKGMDLLVRAFAVVRADIPDAHLTLVGTRPAEVERFLTSAGIESPDVRQSIDALGPATDAVLEAEWARAGIVVVPSRYESFGLVAAEGMARRRVVIATAGGALPEVVADGGIVVPVDDADAMAAALRLVMRDPARAAELRAAARNRYDRCYRPDRLAERLRRLIERVAATAQQRPQ